MQGKDIMTKDLIILHENESIYDAIELFAKNQIDDIPVVKPKKKLIGLITKRHVLQAISNKLDLSLSVSSIMTRDVLTISLDEDISILVNTSSCLPVLSGSKLVGIVSRSDILSGYANYIKQLSIQLDMLLNVIPNLVQTMDREENSNLYNHNFDQSFNLEFLNVIENLVAMEPTSVLQHKIPVNRLQSVNNINTDTIVFENRILEHALEDLEKDILVPAFKKFKVAPKLDVNQPKVLKMSRYAPK